MRLLTALLAATLAGSPLAAEIPIRGRVVDEDAAALAGATVELLGAWSAFERDLRTLSGEREPVLRTVRSEADGSFTIAAPEPGGYRLRVKKRGHLTMGRIVAPLVEGVDLKTVELPLKQRLLLRVADAEGTAVAGALVVLTAHGPPAPYRAWRPVPRRGLTRDDGSVVLAYGDDEVVDFAAWAPGFAVTEAESLALFTEVDVELQPGQPQWVEIHGPDRKPLADVLVRLGDAAVPAGLTGEDGRIRVDAPGRLHAETADGLYGDAQIVADPGGELLVLTLRRPETLSGRVTDAATGRPLAGAWLTFQDRLTTSATDGRYRLPMRLDRLSILRARSAGYLGETVVFRLRPGLELVVEGDLTSRDVKLRPAAHVYGLVVDEGDAPVAGAEVAASTGSTDRSFTRSRADGRFRIPIAPSALASLQVTRPGYLTVEAKVTANRADSPVVVVLVRGRRGNGYVLDLDEQPIAGAEVGLWPVAPGRWDEQQGMAYAGLTGDDGRFVIEELGPGKFNMWATARGFAPYVVKGIEIAFGAAREIDLGTVILEPGASLEGWVVDRDGRAVAEAEVSWSTRDLQRPWDLANSDKLPTDADGRFALSDLIPGEKLDLWVWHRDYGESSARGVECPPEEEIVIVLEKSGRIAGRVVDADGVPVPQAEISTLYEVRSGESYSYRAASDADGVFELRLLMAGRMKLEVRADGFSTAGRWLELAPGDAVDDLVFVLQPSVAALAGRVFSTSEGPVVGALVVLFHGDRGRIRTAGSTDGDGRFRFDGLEVGPARLVVRVRRRSEATREMVIEPGENTVEMRLGEGYEVGGRVVDEQGDGVAGARVSMNLSSAFTDQDGAFTLADVPSGEHLLRARRRGFVVRELPMTVDDAPVFGLEIELGRGGALFGRVLGLEPELLSRVQVLALGGPHRFGTSQVDFAGRYRLESLALGEWMLEARESSRGRVARKTVVLERGLEQMEVDLEFLPGIALSGRVLADGEPEAGAHLGLARLDDGTMARRTRSDHAGRFRIEDVESGRYRLEVRSADLVHSREIEVIVDEDLEIELLADDP
ncbi:MAG: carboxypeptidase regulatory-like domain-containing protein [bacterium]|nr:carboxypeptidase regulatory-like domain-containing protein [bacterium]